MKKQSWLILGDQLFDPSHYAPAKGLPTLMVEDYHLCTHFKYHQKKLVLFLASMRHFANEISEHVQLTYHRLDSAERSSFEAYLEIFLRRTSCSELHLFEINDRFFEQKILKWCAQFHVDVVFHPSPAFLTKRSEFKEYLSEVKRPFMKTFYERRRKETKILMLKNGGPVGGKYSFDQDNRKPFRGQVETLPWPKTSSDPQILKEVCALVDSRFSDHPGSTDDFRWPVHRADARRWFHLFLKERLRDFGPYEDAINQDEDFLFHSLLSPLINIGLLTPAEVIRETLRFAQADKSPLASVEGFIRQLMGWREFIFGIDQNFGERQEEANFFQHSRQMNETWWTGDTGVPILDASIQKANRLGYCHHIERLMVLSNLMLLSELDPKVVHRWFMELFVDSADWVMGPNVYGMGQYSDGGLFATKPYLCGSAYLLKMSDFPKGPWCDEVDGLYWRFIRNHADHFRHNPRMKMMVAASERVKPERREVIDRAASAFLKRNTHP